MEEVNVVYVKEENPTDDFVDARLTPEESEVANLLARAFNKFCELPVLHHQDYPEFVRAIHSAQNIVLARVGLRSWKIYRPENTDDRLDGTPETMYNVLDSE